MKGKGHKGERASIGHVGCMNEAQWQGAEGAGMAWGDTQGGNGK